MKLSPILTSSQRSCQEAYGFPLPGTRMAGGERPLAPEFEPCSAEEMAAAGWAMDEHRDEINRLTGAFPEGAQPYESPCRASA